MIPAVNFNPRSYRRTLTVGLIYTAIIAASFYFAYEVRFDFRVPDLFWQNRLQYIGFVILLKLAALIWAGQFGSLLTYFSIPDLRRLLLAMSGTSGVLFIVRLVVAGPSAPPRGVLLVDFLLSLAGLCSIRLAFRMYRERVTLGRKFENLPQLRIGIIGAGDAGASIASDFINVPAFGFKPVAFYDDDPAKHGKSVHGVPVLGAPELLGVSNGDLDVAKIVIAMPSASVKRIREIVLMLQRRGLKVEILPTIEELASGRVRASRIRPVEIQDLLGREPVQLDSALISRLVAGQVVLVTGAGGSIGCELCRQIAKLNPQRLLMIDQAEGNLFAIEQELIELGFGTVGLPLVADILDPERMEFIFQRYRPHIVFHAAAHKHVFMMERQPAEAIRNNVIGTRQMASFAAKYKARTFVLISTDKAINPTSVMGATKRLAEIQIMAMQAAEASGSTSYMAVRFGNVLGSSGSVIPIFKRQIANGGPVTVTHPDVTRYFMTIPEAVGLVLQSTVMGKGGEIFVLNMGRPVKIVDLARQMIELSGLRPDEDIEIKFSGLKPGEKLFEELKHCLEDHQATEHDAVMRFIGKIQPSDAGLDCLEGELYTLDNDDLKRALQRLVPEYTPYLG
jgi:FlaA1/EpsC-like NDP-sugar epimerase